MHYPQPLLREADKLAQAMAAIFRSASVAGWVLQMLEGDIYSRAYAG